MFDPRHRILVIDDAPELRDVLVAALDPLRFRVTIAAGIPAAAACCRTHEFDLVVCTRVATLASFRSQTRELREPPMLVLTRDACSRPWTMTKTVRFAPRPAAPAELRDLVVRAVS